jgi:hypothetical protein
VAEEVETGEITFPEQRPDTGTAAISIFLTSMNGFFLVAFTRTCVSVCRVVTMPAIQTGMAPTPLNPGILESMPEAGKPWPLGPLPPACPSKPEERRREPSTPFFIFLRVEIFVRYLILKLSVLYCATENHTGDGG